MIAKIYTLIMLVMLCMSVNAQHRYLLPARRNLSNNKDSAAMLLLYSNRSVCKGNIECYYGVLSEAYPIHSVKSETSLKKPKRDLIVHGNVLYNVDYRSFVDTPYAENDIYYHTVQTYLDVTYKEHYPVRVFLTNRFSNSSMMRGFTDLNMQFSGNDFRNRIKQTIKTYGGQRPDVLIDSLQKLRKALEMNKLELQQLKGWTTKSSTIQRLIEAREKARYGNPPVVKQLTTDSLFLQKKPKVPGLKTDAQWRNWQRKLVLEGPSLPDTTIEADTSFPKQFEQTKKKIDSLQDQWIRLSEKYQLLDKRLQGIQKVKNTDVDRAGSLADLDKQIALRSIPDSALPRGFRTLWAIKSFGIGRTMVDYSELSAKNVSINGIQVEYNPSYYVAFAAGTINYRFRDFVVKRGSLPSQHLQVVRFGVGEKMGRNIILTWYKGKRQLYNNAATLPAVKPEDGLMGLTVEGSYKIGESILLTAELAKSSKPVYEKNDQNKGLLRETLSFNDHSNEAYSVKVNSFIKKTDTRFSGFYKHYGNNFQSFSLINTGVRQRSWMLKADQAFFHKKLTVVASVKENDYNNPTATLNYQSNIVFKSLQTTLRMPGWPIFSLGYMPSSQLTRLSDTDYSENVFYSLVANMSYYYSIRDINMNSTAVYTRFYNQQQDSAFVYFNTSNLLYNHAVFWNKLTCQSTASFSFNADYDLYTVEQDAQYSVLNWLSLGAGLKYNYQTGFKLQQFGYKGTGTVKIKKLGEFQFTFDKGFIPGPNRQLVENNTGRFSFMKLF